MIIVPDVLGRAAAADLRARLGDWTRFALLDRGSYDACAIVDEPALFAQLLPMAARAVERPLDTVVSARAVRLRAGDYLLAHHDLLREDNPVEVMLDISAAAVPGAEVHYRRRGKVVLRVPSAPGAAAVVERGPTVGCNHVYVSKRYPAAEIVRIIVLLG